MQVKLLPHLCRLNPSLPITHFCTMKSNPSLKPLRVVPIISQVFPLRLRYQSLSRRPRFPVLCTQQPSSSPSMSTPHQKLLSVRRFSTRSFGPRPGSEARASKSLIEDEAELSDWVGELKSDSFKTRLYSSDDDSGRGKGSDRRRGSDDRGGRDRFSDAKTDDRGGRDRFSNAKRDDRGGRDRFFNAKGDDRGGRDRFSNAKGDDRGGRDRFSNAKGDDRGGRDRFSNTKRDDRGGRDRFSNGKGDDRGGRDRFSNGKGDDRGGRDRFSNAKRDDRGGRDSFSSVKRRRENDLEERDSGRARSSFGRFGGELNGENRKFVSHRGENGARGGKNFSMEKKRNVGLKLGQGLDSRADGGGGGLRRGEKSLPRRGIVASDEEIDEDEDHGEESVMGNFNDLISEEDSEDSEEEDGDSDYKIKNASRLSSSLDEENRPISPNPSVEKGKDESYLSETRFDQCSISPLSLKGIKDAGYEKMTVVQEATLPVILKGKDVLAKAKTGTGKTVAFLLPSIEVVIKSPPVGRDERLPPILVLVICPTRELASQAAAEAKTLLKYHPSIGVQVVIGGTRLALEQRRMQANPFQILVATPGRLRDHTENTAGFATRLKGVKVLVLDEADHLLDMGFRKDIEKIIAAVPKQRQTLLFSATVPEEVRLVSNIALKRDHEFINTVQKGTEETHSQVRQMHLVASLDKHFSLLYVLLKEHIADDVDYKVLVFCTTAMVTRLVADLLGELNLNVREIHSRKPQSYRTRISDEFRKSKGLILVTSDVSARGVDYPDVTLVIQVGLPADKEQYIHRLGRTGRKGKAGQGILLLAPWEEFFLSTLKDLPIKKAQLPAVDRDTSKKVERALSQVEMKNKEAAYQAWLGYYNSNKIVGKDKYRLVELANEFSRSMGLDNPPAIPKLVIGKMGLRNILGLRSK